MNMELVGRKYGRLLVTAPHPKSTTTNHRQWICRCDCGGEKIVSTSNLNSGNVSSCGCAYIESRDQGVSKITHGKTSTPEYKVWNNMLQRCSNPKSPSFPRYGGRGIAVSEDWRSFENFHADMGDRPSPAHSIERQNNDGNYEPGNCRWATKIEQDNNRRTSVRVRLAGEEVTLAEASRRTGIASTTLQRVIKRGEDIDSFVSRRSH